MTPTQLKEFVAEMIAFLQALDKVMPKVDAELIAFLQSIQDTPWLADLLVKVLEPQQKQAVRR